MAQPLINGLNVNSFGDPRSDALTEFDSTIKSELLLESATRKQLTEGLGKDAAAYKAEPSQLISEELQPLLDLLSEGQQKDQSESAPSDLKDILGATDQVEEAHSSEDQRTINDILAALNSQQPQSAQSEPESPLKVAERRLLRTLEAEVEVRQEQERATPESEVAPMIEAITSPMPQVEIQLPGGGELLIAINPEGNPQLLYTAPDGTLRTLAKGKTLRLQRWVNGITYTKDGTITFSP